MEVGVEIRMARSAGYKGAGPLDRYKVPQNPSGLGVQMCLWFDLR